MKNILGDTDNPYLLQHKNNPVHWQKWGKEAFHLAQSQNKLMIISIGYSTCHWCHVMERESFEDPEVADLMNKYFIPVKVDREEHSEVDAYYMDAVTSMSGRGGWPLNVICLPDGKAVYGGTYFPKINWLKLLEQLATKYEEEPKTFRSYADKLSFELRKVHEFRENTIEVNKEELTFALEKLIKRFDFTHGGRKSVPKFPMPSLLLMLHFVNHKIGDKRIHEFLKLTLTKMNNGSLFDQIGGG